MATSIQEAQWVLRAQCDDREALESLLRDVQPRIHRYLRSLVGEDDADDVLQDVLILICRSLASLHTPELFRPWGYRIASREAFKHLKRQRRRPERAQDELVPLEELSISAADPSPVAPATGIRESLLDADTVTPANSTRKTLKAIELLSKQ